MTPPAHPVARADAGLLLSSAAILTLEVLQTRIFAFSLDPLTIYLAIGVCLLGLGAAGTRLALSPPPSPAAALPRAARCAALGALTVVPAHVVFAFGSAAMTAGGSATLVVLAVLTIPYFCFGMATTLLLMARGAAIGRVYAVNLVGSGLGCLLVFPLLDHLGAERALAIVAGLGLAGALILAPLPGWRLVGAAVLAALAFAATLRVAPALLRFRPDAQGQLSHLLVMAKWVSDRYGKVETARPILSRWDRTARVDVWWVGHPQFRTRAGDPLDVLFFAQDASAGSILLGVESDLGRARDFFERTVYGAGYARAPVRDVLVVGLGGAPDVLTALHHGAAHIDAVEINRATIDLVRQDFRTFLGDPYARPEVTVHQLDGRTFARLSERTYDLVQMSGADTKSIFASGSLSVNENYLYTREGIRDFLRRLKPEGVLAIIRFGSDAVRLTTTAVAALRDLGATAPEQHFMVVGQGEFWVSVLVKRSPFTKDEITAMHRWVRPTTRPTQLMLPPYDWMEMPLQVPLRVLYSPPPRHSWGLPVFEALGTGSLARFEAENAARGRDVSPPEDDRPFFFFNVTPAAALRLPPPLKVLEILYRLVVGLAVIAGALILLPLVAWRRQGLRAPHAVRTLVYFACLGAGFMLVEIGLIHRFVLLLGHQSYAVTVVVFGLLAGAGAGSLFSGRLGVARRGPLGAALVVLILVILAHAAALAVVLDVVASAGFGVRLALALTLLLGLGFCLGIPFPSGLRAVEGTSPALVAWAVGINGFASVLGSTLAIPLAMIAGLRALLLLGAALYALALLTAPTARAA